MKPIQTKKDILRWLDKMSISGYTINDDLTVDVSKDVILSEKRLTEIPIQFRIVTGSFICANNKLTSLKGSPRECHGYFVCSKNKLTNLDYAPSYVKMFFDCSKNELTSLKNAPIEVSSFLCQDNQLTNIDHISTIIHDSINLSNNNLNNINAFKTLKNTPQLIEVSNNPNLTDFTPLNHFKTLERLILMNCKIPSILNLGSINITQGINHAVKNKNEIIPELEKYYFNRQNQFVLSILPDEFNSILEKYRLDLSIKDKEKSSIEKKMKI